MNGPVVSETRVDSKVVSLAHSNAKQAGAAVHVATPHPAALAAETPNPGAGFIQGTGALPGPGAGAGAAPGAVAELTVTELINRVIEGSIPPESVSAERRRECLAVLIEEGYTTSQLAQVFRVADRTIRRDRVELRREQSLEPSLTLSDELLGEFREQTMATIQRLRRLTRDEKAPATIRFRAEEAVSRVYERFLQMAVELGYVRSAQPRLSRMVEEADAERVKERLASGVSPEEEILGPKMAVLMGFGALKQATADSLAASRAFAKVAASYQTPAKPTQQ